MLNNELDQQLLSHGPLLNEEGNLTEAGYAPSLVKIYDRNAIKARKMRIKEWDYYYCGNAHFGVALTIADNSYMSLVSMSFLNFDEKKDITKSKIKFFSFGKLHLPPTSQEGNISIKWKGVEMSFLHENGKRHLTCHYQNFVSRGKDLRLDLYLEETNQDSMVIATPFPKDQHFYYNQKINLLKGNGYVKVGDDVFNFDEHSYGVLDWGRGVWTYRNTWYWGSMNGEYKGQRFGLNLGYGFGDTSKASENMFFINDEAYKLHDVRFVIPYTSKGKIDYLSPWKIESQTKDINLIFNPLLNRHANMNIGIIQSNQNQVFGTFSGSILVNNQEIYFEDIPGFAEKVTNRW